MPVSTSPGRDSLLDLDQIRDTSDAGVIEGGSLCRLALVVRVDRALERDPAFGNLRGAATFHLCIRSPLSAVM